MDHKRDSYFFFKFSLGKSPIGMSIAYLIQAYFDKEKCIFAHTGRIEPFTSFGRKLDAREKSYDQSDDF